MNSTESQSRIVAIHQPNFFPWLGYFYKIAHSDVFIFFDDVEFSKGSYTNRCRICTEGNPKWLTLPIQYKSTATIADIQLGQDNWQDKHKRALHGAYRRAPYFDTVFPVIEQIYDRSATNSVGAFNIDVITELVSLFGLQVKLLKSSGFNAPGRNEDKLCALVNMVGGTHYLSGKGGRNYQSVETYEAAGIALQYTDFSPVEYPQSSETFQPGLSVLDAMFNVGIDATRQFIKHSHGVS